MVRWWRRTEEANHITSVQRRKSGKPNGRNCTRSISSRGEDFIASKSGRPGILNRV